MTPALIPLTLLLATTSAACAPQDKPNPPAQPVLAMTNPAATFCLSQGGRLVTRKDSKGNETAYCHLPDGRVIEEWAFFRQSHPMLLKPAPKG